ncbi:AAA family ATPase [Tepidimicrobium xylanilyticum]|uniref:Nuclease SbcCD subunit C n=1 Tax=Tepidimicrobium xylanilyticum TaxID=1123352 RepID=A0A1H2YAA2_9FIRM|nr:AAA family ATPase [Tepidimicrobium xylanilyticum]GMG97078.1 hypothetical protein EN5CB1_19040 [Tepidimicrobium xylanilyticum]SDX01594.1 exonuclease SbcC [Tepidimicrobium xylanilyticum]
MKYIKKIILENFQSHKYTEIELDPYLNVIVGPSDHGKTAIIRGLRWALFNEPSGDFFIREGEKDCSVTVIFSDNTKIKRYRSKSKNSYYLYNSQGEKTIFEGFGTKVPKEIIDQISMRKISLDGDQSNLINISEQLEGPFLLSEKNSAKANAIGRLVGVHIIDDAIKDTLKDIRNLNLKKKNLEEMLKKLQIELAEYDYLDSLIEIKDNLIKIKSSIYNSQVRLNRLIEISDSLKEISEEILFIKEYLNKLKNIDEMKEIERKLSNKINNFNSIFNKYSRLEAINRDIAINKAIIQGLKGVDRCSEINNLLSSYIDRMIKLDRISKLLKEANKKIIYNNQILKFLREIEKVRFNIEIAKSSYEKMTQLMSTKAKLDSINKSIAIGENFLDKLSQIDRLLMLKDTLENKYSRLKSLLDCYDRYNKINITKLDTEKNLKELEERLNSQLNRYKTLLTELKVCPLCFSSIDRNKIEEIIENFR